MDFGKLPTDSLYKFLAISGVALMVASFVWPMQLAREARASIESRVQAVGSEMAGVMKHILTAHDETKQKTKIPPLGPVPASYVPQDEVDRAEGELIAAKRDVHMYLPPVESANEENRKVWKAYVERVGRLASAEGNLAGKYSYLRDDELIEKLTHKNAAGRKLKPEEARMYVEVLEQQGAARELVAVKLIGNAFSIWNATDEVEYFRSVGNWGLRSGAVMALFGFGLWWWRVQRLQDSILKCDAVVAARMVGRRRVGALGRSAVDRSVSFGRKGREAKVTPGNGRQTA